MNIETRDVKVHRLEFTDDELARIIADPNEFVAELVRRMPASDGVNKPAAQKRAKKNGATPHQTRIGRPPKMMACPGCGEKFSIKGLGPHKRRCPKYQVKKVAGTLPADE